MRAGWTAAVALAATATSSSPATPVSYTFLCFFDEGSAGLSAQCQRTAVGFAQWWLRAHRGEGGPLAGLGTLVELAGHADAAEQAAGKALPYSKVRTEAVAAFLRLNDVPAEAIKMTWYGAFRLLVPDKGAKSENRRDAKSPELEQALQKHRAETEQQLQRLEQIQSRLGGQHADIQNETVMTTLRTGKDLQSRIADETLAEALMITGAQIIEHYEIAGYGSAAAHAKQLGRDEDPQLLLQSLEEEKRTDELLTEIAQGPVDRKAAEWPGAGRGGAGRSRPP